MSSLELFLNENKGKILEFSSWQIIGHHLYYKHDRTIHSIMTMLGDEEITFFMKNGLTFEIKLVDNILMFSGMSVHGKAISVDYTETEYKWL